LAPPPQNTAEREGVGTGGAIGKHYSPAGNEKGASQNKERASGQKGIYTPANGI